MAVCVGTADSLRLAPTLDCSQTVPSLAHEYAPFYANVPPTVMPRRWFVHLIAQPHRLQQPAGAHFLPLVVPRLADSALVVQYVSFDWLRRTRSDRRFRLGGALHCAGRRTALRRITPLGPPPRLYSLHASPGRTYACRCGAADWPDFLRVRDAAAAVRPVRPKPAGLKPGHCSRCSQSTA